MSITNGIVKELRESQDKQQRHDLIEKFRQLPAEQKNAAIPELVELFEDENWDEQSRSWVPSFLGLIGTPEMYEVMARRLPVESSGLVRSWIIKSLARYFTLEERLDLIINHYDGEANFFTRRTIARILDETCNPKNIAKLIELLDDDDRHIRKFAAEGLGCLKADEAVSKLIERLAKEEAKEIKGEIIRSLITIGHQKTIPTLIDILQHADQLPELNLPIIEALTQLGTPNNNQVIDVLIENSCQPNRIIAITAADGLIGLLGCDEVAKRLVAFGLKTDDRDMLYRIADALRFVGSTETVGYLQVTKDPIQEKRAQILLEQIGGQQAFNILIENRMQALNKAEDRVRKFDEEALRIFKETIQEAQRGFGTSLWMSRIIFAVGILLLIVSIIGITQSEEGWSQVIWAGGGASGLATILAMFYRGPLDRIEQAVANLVQTEIAFLGYIRQVTQVTAMFEREYLDNEKFGLTELKKILSYTEHTIKETMPLVNKYTAVSLLGTAKVSAKKSDRKKT